MAYIKFVVDGPIKAELSEREINILQTSFLNFAAMTNAIITGVGVMLNPPDEGELGITFAYPEEISKEKETEVRDSFLRRLNMFFEMSKLDLTASIK